MANSNDRMLPANLDAERFVLGSILLDDSQLPIAAQSLDTEDFSTERHRRIFGRMNELYARGEKIDRVTLAEELSRRNQLESTGGLTYLVSLDDGLPKLDNIGSYIAIVKEKAKLRKLLFSLQSTMNAVIAQDQTAKEIIATTQQDLVAIGGLNDASGQMISEYIDQFPGGINRLLNPAQFDQGIATGFFKLDEWTSGIHPKEIWTIAARPAQGKSSLGLNIISSIAKRGGFCVFFSLEMSKQSCLNRLMCAEARVDLNRFRAGYLRDDERIAMQTALSKINRWPIYIDDSSGLTAADIGMRIQGLCRETPIALCGIDFFQLLRPKKGRRFNNENEAFTEIGHDLQLIAKSTGVPLMILSQLNRESERATGDKRPKLSQCRGSGTIEEISDLGIVIFREEVYRRDRDDLKGLGLLLVEKSRNGPTGEIGVVYLSNYTKFENRAEDLPDTDYKAAAAGE